MVAAMTDTFERAKAAFLEGVEHSEAGRDAEAEACFEASLALWPQRSSTLFNLGAVRVRLGKHEAALQALDGSLAIDPEQADAWCQRGIALLHLKRTQDAVASFERALRLDAHHAASLYHLGCALNDLHQHERALALFERLLKVAPERAEAWFRHGQTLQALDRHAQALPSYERALALDAAMPQAWINRAGILKDSGRTADAIAAYREAIAHGAERELVQFYLAPLEGRTTVSAPRSYVQGLFDDYADRFDAHLLNALRYRGHEILVDALKRAAPGRRFAHALDVGCGTGLCGALLKPLADRLDGVDLAPQMLAQAQRLRVYDTLVQADVTEHLRSTGARHDLVCAADVFTYVGDIEPVFAALARVLLPGGVFAFSVEAAPDSVTFELRGSLRFAHSRRHVEALAQRHGYTLLQCVRQPMREDQHRPIDALYVVLTR
jgi:predicted TPR repeat methyltransferase